MPVDNIAIISSTNAAVGVNTSSSAVANERARVDYESFLKLLVAEMNNQDPTEPIDSTQYVSQLAMFSQVEQAVQSNTKLDKMLATNALLLAESFVGRSVTSPDGTQFGVVKSVKVTDDSAVVVLEDGSEFAAGPGVTIE
jgi:flagellar basal-body rod modification protein FlgD